jgi:hypothetical protein
MVLVSLEFILVFSVCLTVRLSVCYSNAQPLPYQECSSAVQSDSVRNKVKAIHLSRPLEILCAINVRMLCSQF